MHAVRSTPFSSHLVQRNCPPLKPCVKLHSMLHNTPHCVLKRRKRC